MLTLGASTIKNRSTGGRDGATWLENLKVVQSFTREYVTDCDKVANEIGRFDRFMIP